MILRLPQVGETWLAGIHRVSIKIIDTVGEYIVYNKEGSTERRSWSKTYYFKFVSKNPMWVPQNNDIKNSTK